MIATRSVLSALLATVACTGAASCTRDPLVVGTGEAIEKAIPVNPDLDVLFVVDNSASTQDKQLAFASAFPAFVSALDAFPGGRPSLHLGVVSSTVDIGETGFEPSCPSPAPLDNGLLQSTPRIAGCTAPSGRFITDIKNDDGTRTTNYSGTLADTFSCVAELGTDGCGFEAPMLAIQRALDGTRPENAGFLRPGADLLIVILADEDDCSASDPAIFAMDPNMVGGLSDFRCQPLFAYDCDQPIVAAAQAPGAAPATYTTCRTRTDSFLLTPASLATTLAGIKDPSQTAVALVAGDPESTIQVGALDITGDTQNPALLPSCSATINGNPAIARPGIRLKAFADQYAERSTFHSVCDPDYGAALTDMGAQSMAMMSSCMAPGIDVTDRDLANPGVQPSCVIGDATAYRTAEEQDALIPACKMADASTPDSPQALPCWWMQRAAACGGSGLQLQIERNAAPPDGTVVTTSCASVP